MSNQRVRRLLLAFSLFAWFFWLGIEDRNIYFVLALGVLAALDALLVLPVQDWLWTVEGAIKPLAAGLLGVVLGACIPASAALLMLVKVSLHSHSQPDFSLNQVVSMLSVIPAWAVAGGLIASAWLIIRA